MTANDPGRYHYQVSGRTALFMRQSDKTLIPYDPQPTPTRTTTKSAKTPGRYGRAPGTVGRLDFLCTDPSTGALVVVELKRGRPSDKVVGQAARYVGYVRTRLAAPGQPVEGLIVAHDAEETLRYAVAAFPGLQLMTYGVTFQLSTVDDPPGP